VRDCGAREQNTKKGPSGPGNISSSKHGGRQKCGGEKRVLVV
jgi:hypothetical protein